jgi:lipoprotein-anchoring transpeptidase ErfK/SrfK
MGGSANHRLVPLGLVLLVAACGAQSSPPGATSTTLPPTTSSTTLPASTTTSSPAPSTTSTTSSTTTSTTLPPTTTTTTLLPALGIGDRGPDVGELQTRLAAAGLFRDAIDGVFGARTGQAVVAFHKAIDADRVEAWSDTDWQQLADFEATVPDRPDEPDRIEIDLTRQLLYRVESGEVVDIIPVSTGNGELYENSVGTLVRARTPRGDFRLYLQRDGWHESYLGGMYEPWYFYGGYAVHGSASVPPFPASHGCVRVPLWEADHLTEVLWIGLPVHVWDEG